jgi:Sec-independent protein translocase protein TatA
VDVLLILIIVLIAVIIWRGPKTLPMLGKAFGQGVKEARKEMDGMREDMSGDKKDDAATPPPPPPSA